MGVDVGGFSSRDERVGRPVLLSPVCSHCAAGKLFSVCQGRFSLLLSITSPFML